MVVDGAGVVADVSYTEIGGSCILSGLVRDLRAGGGRNLGYPVDLDLNTFGDVGDEESTGEGASDEISRAGGCTSCGLRSGCIGGGAISAGRVGDTEICRGSSVKVTPGFLPRSGDRENGDFPRFFMGDNRALATDS